MTMFPNLEDLKVYFEKSMDYFNNYSRLFKKRYPQVAEMLDITESKVGDPDVLRLFEAFALFDARLNWSIDQNKDLFGNFLLSMVCPELLVPIPSACIVEIKSQDAYGAMRIPRFTEMVCNNNCKFRSGADFDLFHGHIENCELADVRGLDGIMERFTTGLFIDLKIQNYSPTTLLYFNLDYESAVKMIRIFLDAKVYLDGEQVGFLSLPEEYANFCTPAICGNPYHEVYEYSILKEKYCFLKLNLQKRLEKGIYKLLIPADGTEKGEVHERMLLTNCIPVINLFKKGSDPIKLDLYKDEYELFPDIDREFYKIHSVETVNLYEQRSGSIPLQQNEDYFIRTEEDRFLVSVKSSLKMKNQEQKTLYADLLCSNGEIVSEIKLGSNLIMNRFPQIKVNILTKPSKSKSICRSDKWRLLSLFTQNIFLRNDIDLLKFISDVGKLYDLEVQSFIAARKNYSYGIRKTDFMWNSVFGKEVFEIVIDSNTSLLEAIMWARIFINSSSIQSACEVKILDKSENLIKLIEEV